MSNKKSLVNVMSVREADDEGRKSTRIVYVENHIDSKGRVKKHVEVDDNPQYTFYLTKPEVELDTARNFIEKDNVVPVTVRYDDMDKEIARRTKQMDFFNACIRNARYRDLRNLMRHKDVHLADMDLTDYKIREWIVQNAEQTTTIPLRKAYFDIEVDISECPEGEFPDEELAEYPVALISYLHEPTMEIHSFILKNDDNESQALFLEALAEHHEDYVEALIEEINTVPEGSKNNFAKVTNVIFHIHDDELELIRAFFAVVHEDQPDFGLGWNLGFDVLTLAGRCKHFRKKPSSVMCPPDFPFKQIDLRKDTVNTDFSKRKTVMEVTGYTQYVDLLECFASIRATMGKRESYSLDAILLEELGEGKYEYNGTIRDALYVDFENFLKYSIYDSYRLYQLETKNKDVDLLYTMGLMTATRFKKVMTKTISIRNLAAQVLEKEGYILSNNRNKFNEQTEKQKFRGAWVGMPENLERVGIKIGNSEIRSDRVYENVIDEDLASLYPSILLAFNIDAETMLGKIFFEDDAAEHDDEFPMRVSEGDVVLLGKEYLGLPSVEEVLMELGGN